MVEVESVLGEEGQLSTRVLVIALDAADAPLIERWSTQGRLPNITALCQRAQAFTLRTPMRTLPGAIWPELSTGLSSWKIGQYYLRSQLHTGESVPRPIAAEEIDAECYYWVRAARAGLRVASLDMPHSIGVKGLDGVQLIEWGIHDNHCFGTAGIPDSFLQSVRMRYGDYPVQDCESHHCELRDYETLIRDLKTGAALKAALFEDTLRGSAWDLFTGCLTELHCAGHQLWHFQDEAHLRYGADAPPELRHAIRDLYALVDEGVGRLVAAAGPDAHVVLIALHGVTRYSGGPNILPEVLARLGLASSSDGRATRLARQIQREGRAIPKMARAIARLALGPALTRKLQRRFGALHRPFTDTETKAGAVFNNGIGAIRLNLRGREPFGTVEPGNAAETLIEDIRLALGELRHVRTGAPIVAETFTPRDAFGPDHHPDLPDLFVVFRTDLGVIEKCESPRLGQLDVCSDQALAHRSGDHHTEDARLWIVGPRVIPGPYVASGSVLDLAPTVLDLLGVGAPERIDGRSLLAVVQRRDDFFVPTG